jgi:hypothetical protein
MAEEYPWFLETYDGYPFPIQRADAIRYFVLAHFGGTYLDLDDVRVVGQHGSFGTSTNIEGRVANDVWIRSSHTPLGFVGRNRPASRTMPWARFLNILSSCG